MTVQRAALVVLVLALATTVAACSFGPQREVAVLGAGAPVPTDCRELGGGWAWEGSKGPDGTVVTVGLSSPGSRGLDIGDREGLQQRRAAGWNDERVAALDYLGWEHSDAQAMFGFAGSQAEYDAVVADVTRRLAAARVCPSP